MKQFEAHGTTFFYGIGASPKVSMQPTAPGGCGFTCEWDALEAFVAHISPASGVSQDEVSDLKTRLLDATVRAEAAEAALADQSGPESERTPLSAEADVSFLRGELANAEVRIKALEAHVLRLESDARTAKRVREAIVGDVLRTLEPYRRV